MAQHERRAVQFADDEGGWLYAVWSRSGKRLIVSARRRDSLAQVDLGADQVEKLIAFLSETVALNPHDR